MNEQDLQAAISAGPGFVEIPPGTISITEPIVLRSGVHLVGHGHGASVLSAAGDMPTLIDSLGLVVDVGLHNLTIDCGRDRGLVVNTAVYIDGRRSRIKGCSIQNGYEGVVYKRNPGLGWIHWLTENHIRRFTGYGVVFDTTDSFVSGNYFRAAVIQRGPGGNSWTGNHFTADFTTGDLKTGLELVSEEENSAIFAQVVGNYFDEAKGAGAAALRIRPFAGRVTACVTITGNAFRANVVDVEVLSADGFLIGHNVHNGSPSSQHGIRLVDSVGSVGDYTSSGSYSGEFIEVVP